jgi:hypothetical protein
LIGSRAALRTAAILLLGCANRGQQNTVVDVKVDLSYRPLAGRITMLRTKVEDTAQSATRDFTRAGNLPLVFPTSFGIEVSPDVAGPLRIEVRGLDAAGTTLARGTIASQPVVKQQTVSVKLWLECAVDCPADAGTDARAPDAASDGRGGDVLDTCGNGKLEAGETCDIGIPRGMPGACPPMSCDDGLACTLETRQGSGCNAVCVYTDVTGYAADGCCPSRATVAMDPDCSASCGNGSIEPGEFCDQGVQPGQPTACPVAANCVDTDKCTSDQLLSAMTCNARCVHREITQFISGDGCCPAGANHVSDTDCPVVCGNGVQETMDGEKCDIAIAPEVGGACPTEATCKAMAKIPCNTYVLEGTGCQTVCKMTPITQFVAGDGCCPRGGNRVLDPDCAAECGNGVLEPGELCEQALPADRMGACPTSCPQEASGCMRRVLTGSSADCTARCVSEPISTCSTQRDGCCPANCSATDPDCSQTCGNGAVEAGETCDTALAPGAAGACPLQCPDRTCESASLLSRGTCNARCEYTPIVTFTSGDGCCPMGGNHNLDGDCPFVCGNGVVEAPKESCDRTIAAGLAGACPSSCPVPMACKRYSLQGEAASCTARCEVESILTCVSNDGCCPTGCQSGSDNDCPPVCGNGVLDQDEICDKGITAGHQDSCPYTCDDGNACTVDSTSGKVSDCTRSCGHTDITACAAGDRCCPNGCTAQTDSDCSPICGNGVVEAKETCDPVSSCPTTCADDLDVCTTEMLKTDLGNPCSVMCLHLPILNCSGSTADRCCPTGCSPRSDSAGFDTDCAGGNQP